MYCLFLGDPTLVTNYTPLANSFFDHFEARDNGTYALKTQDGQYVSQRAGRGQLIYVSNPGPQERCYVSDPAAIVGAVSMSADTESQIRPLYYFQKLL